MEQKFDRSAEDLGNSVQLEHLNLTVPDQQTAILFYITGLGFTRDPYIMTGLENMWVNIGRSQIHLPVKKAQVLRGHTGLVVPNLDHLVKRLATVRDRLAQTRFGFERQNGHVQVTCPWGNTFRCFGPDEKRFGRIVLGMPYIAFDVQKGAADKIARFYRKIMGIPAEVEKTARAASAKVLVGAGQHLYFNEIEGELAPYDGHHIQLYVANFSGPHRQLNERGLVFEESDRYQYRFRQIVDPDTGEPVYEIEHEIRSITHPLYARPLLNRNPSQTNRVYYPGHDSMPWTLGHDA
jgi:catechol-2,3-dioxygenase